MKSAMFRIVLLCSLFLCLPAKGQELDMDSDLDKLVSFFQALNGFSRYIPQEKVYLHFDNTSYYQGDPVWFKCYVTSGQHQLSKLSKTLYVELLNPGGEIVDKRILKIENGQCHGEFALNHLPFYSGFYEVRAYTKYMLNFGDDVIFSRLLPVFDRPKTEGDFEEKVMLSYGRYGTKDRPLKRESPERGRAVNVRFFPEGGNLVQGIASQVAFEVTDEVGNPIDVTGVIIDENRQEAGIFSTLHEGRGIFTYTPSANTGRRRSIAEVEYAGRKYQFDLPASLPQGVVMEVDNLAHADSIGITLRKNSNTPADLFGIAVLHGGKLQNYCAVPVEKDELNFKLDKTQLPSGVSQIVLFNRTGDIVCDRLIFTNKNDQLGIKAKTDKPVYQPYEPVEMELSVADRSGNPVHTTFSLSVRDGENEVEHNHSILTDLLLMSEIKGYVRNPAYYFEEKNDSVETRRATSLLDLLLMVQGWRRYSWQQMAGVESIEMKYLPEQGIETHGTILAVPLIGRNLKPKPKVDVGLLLQKREEGDEEGESLVETFVTDNQGRFAFVSDVEGRWGMVLTAREKGKLKNHQIILDRVFSPVPKRYRYADLQINIAENNPAFDDDVEESPEEDPDLFFIVRQDSLAKLGIDEKVYQLEEVMITANRRTREQDIYRNRSTSVAYYDVASEYDNIYDSGNVFIGNNIHELLINMNQDFEIRNSQNFGEILYYKGRAVVFVVNYKQTDLSSEFDVFKYKDIRVQAIKSIYINETVSAFCQYAYHPSPLFKCTEASASYGCVFIETYPDDEISVDGAKGVRKTWLEGYSPVKEFYNPDYSALPPIPDYRRTLYWNPSVTTDENGNAKITFYNNSSCRNFNISAETVTPHGVGIHTYE